MSQMLPGVDRKGLIKAVAVYLAIYAVLNACGGVLTAFAGGVTGLMGVAGGAAGAGAGLTAEEQAVLASATGLGAILTIYGILSLISVPVFAVAAYGLFTRTSWARNGAIAALGASIVLSLISLIFIGGGIMSIIWIVISGAVLYMFMTDTGIRAELG